MFWSGRYAERAEDLVRLVITAQRARRAARTTRPRARAAPLCARSSACCSGCAGTRWLDTDLEQRSLLRGCRPPRLGGALAPAPARRARGRARPALGRHLAGVRQHRPRDEVAAGDRARPQIAESASRMLGGILSLQGVTANMIRDDGWHAIEAGRYLERSLQVCTLLAATTTVSPRRRRRPGRARRRADGRRELGDPPPPLPRQRPHRRRARAAAARPRQPAVDRVLARAAAVPPVEAGRLDRVHAPGAPARAPRGRARGRRHRRADRARRRSPARSSRSSSPRRMRSCTGSATRSCTCTSPPARCRSRSRRSR